MMPRREKKEKSTRLANQKHNHARFSNLLHLYYILPVNKPILLCRHFTKWLACVLTYTNQRFTYREKYHFSSKKEHNNRVAVSSLGLKFIIC